MTTGCDHPISLPVERPTPEMISDGTMRSITNERGRGNGPVITTRGIEKGRGIEKERENEKENEKGKGIEKEIEKEKGIEIETGIGIGSENATEAEKDCVIERGISKEIGSLAQEIEKEKEIESKGRENKTESIENGKGRDIERGIGTEIASGNGIWIEDTVDFLPFHHLCRYHLDVRSTESENENENENEIEIEIEIEKG